MNSLVWLLQRADGKKANRRAWLVAGISPMPACEGALTQIDTGEVCFKIKCSRRSSRRKMDVGNAHGVQFAGIAPLQSIFGNVSGRTGAHTLLPKLPDE